MNLFSALELGYRPARSLQDSEALCQGLPAECVGKTPSGCTASVPEEVARLLASYYASLQVQSLKLAPQRKSFFPVLGNGIKTSCSERRDSVWSTLLLVLV